VTRICPKCQRNATHGAMTEEGPQTIIHRHLEILRSALAAGYVQLHVFSDV